VGFAAILLAACSLTTDFGALTSGGSASPAGDGATTADGANPDAEGLDGSSSESGATTDAGTLPFVDDFGRPDGPTVGNGWVMKQLGAFALVGGTVNRVVGPSSDYRDNVCYRPASEDVRDVEVSVELKITALPPGYPQVLVRIRESTVATQNLLDGYLLYINDAVDEASLTRQRGGSLGPALQIITLSPSLNTTDKFRLRLRATGKLPVMLAAFVERHAVGDSDPTHWDIVGQASFADSGPSHLEEAGSVGFSAGQPETTGLYAYDNFVRTPL
jgi:hypothetical protein